MSIGRSMPDTSFLIFTRFKRSY